MNAVNRDYQEMLAERMKIHSDLELKRAEVRRLAAGVALPADAREADRLAQITERAALEAGLA